MIPTTLSASEKEERNVPGNQAALRYVEPRVPKYEVEGQGERSLGKLQVHKLEPRFELVLMDMSSAPPQLIKVVKLPATGERTNFGARVPRLVRGILPRHLRPLEGVSTWRGDAAKDARDLF
jgi:hypothetical protein